MDSIIYNIQYILHTRKLRDARVNLDIKYIVQIFLFVPIIQNLLYTHVEKDMTVYIVQELRGRNFSDATSFGDCEILLSADVQTYSTLPVIRKLTNRLANFCDDDYLLLAGDPAAIALSACIAARNNNHRIKMLKWDRLDEKYYPLYADITGKGVTNEKV